MPKVSKSYAALDYRRGLAVDLRRLARLARQDTTTSPTVISIDNYTTFFRCFFIGDVVLSSSLMPRRSTCRQNLQHPGRVLRAAADLDDRRDLHGGRAGAADGLHLARAAELQPLHPRLVREDGPALQRSGHEVHAAGRLRLGAAALRHQLHLRRHRHDDLRRDRRRPSAAAPTPASPRHARSA